MHLMKAVSIFITGISGRCMIDILVLVAPCFQTSVDVVFVGKNETASLNSLFENRLDGLLLHILKHLQHDLTTTLDHAENRRFLPFQCPRPRLPLSRRQRPARPSLATTCG